MKVYDAHMHIAGTHTPDPKGLLQKMEAGGVWGGCVFSVDPVDPGFTYEQRMENLFAWVEGYENRLFPVAWLHPHENDIEKQISDCAKRGVAAFKFIPDTYTVQDEKAMHAFRLIEETGLPIFFHSGILYDFFCSSPNNRPVLWENFVHFRKLRFSMAHCGNPWYDECFSLYGKFCWMEHHVRAAAKGEYTNFANYPWVQSHLLKNTDPAGYEVPELYLDTTPGPAGIVRRDMLTRLHSRTPDAYKVMFGTDAYVDTYASASGRYWLDMEKEILDAVGASETFRQNMYANNLFRFLNKPVPQE